MATINLLRYSSAKTKAEVLLEVSTANSKDHGTGASYKGLCAAVEAGQDFDPTPLVDPFYISSTAPRYKINLMSVVSTPSQLEADICSQGVCPRKMWRLTVDMSDIIGLADRSCNYGYGNAEYLADGVILRTGAKVLAVEAVSR